MSSLVSRLALSVLIAASCLSTGADAARKAVVVVAERLVLDDITSPELHNLARLMRNGAVGLVSANCAGPNTEPAALLTAAAGERSRGGPWVADCYAAGELIEGDQLAGAAHAVRTGYHAGPRNGVFPGLPQADRENQERFVSARLGMLGQMVHRAGRKTAAIGSADCPPDTIDRSAAVLAADFKGLIDYADFGSPFSGPAAQAGLLSDPAILADKTLAALEKADLVVVDFGDTRRLDNLKISMSEAAYEAHKTTALHNLDKLLGRLSAVSETAVVFVSFAPPLDSRWSQLTPIVIYSPPLRGVITSPTTRTTGLIAASDFAPTVLNVMGIRLEGDLQHQAHVERVADRLPEVGRLSSRVTANKKLEVPVLWSCVLVGGICLTVACVLISFNVRAKRRVWKWLRTGMLVSAAAPLAMLAAAAATTLVGSAAVVVLGTLLLVVASLVLGKRFGRAGPVRILFGLTVLVLAVDSLTGFYLAKFAIPSTLQLTGDRYYGIGNEYAGMLIAMAAVSVLLAGKKVRRSLTLPVGAFLVVILGFGAIGANYGGAVTAIVALVLIWLSISRGGFRGRGVALSVVLASAVAGVLAYVDWWMNGATGTHGGRMAGLVYGSGTSYLLVIVARKVLMNLTLLASGHARNAFAFFTPFIVLWFWGIQGRIRAMLGDDKAAVAGFKAIVIASIVAFLVNDSGVVMANLMLSMTVLALIYSLVEGAEAECRES